MHWAHVHLLVNHIPVFGTLFSLLLLAEALWKGTEELKRGMAGESRATAAHSASYCESFGCTGALWKFLWKTPDDRN